MPRRQVRWLLPMSLLVLAIVLVAFQVQRPSSLVRVGIPWALAGAAASIMTPIIIAGGIDLSVGSIAALCGMLCGVIWQQGLLAPLPAAVAAVAGGALCGAANGALVVIGLSPLVATLATMAFFSGLAMAVSRAQRITGFPEAFHEWSELAGVPVEYWLLLTTSIIAWCALHHTRWGRWCYAIGDNPVAARFAAVPVALTRSLLYTASGLVAGGIGVISVMYQRSAIPDAHQGLELRAIACVVVGGTLITGGRGSMWQTVLGLAVVAGLDVGLEFLAAGMPLLSQQSRLVIIGLLVIILAIWNQRLVQRADRE